MSLRTPDIAAAAAAAALVCWGPAAMGLVELREAAVAPAAVAVVDRVERLAVQAEAQVLLLATLAATVELTAELVRKEVSMMTQFLHS